MSEQPRRKVKRVDNCTHLVDKPTEWTSHDVVAKSVITSKAKVGHGGTLDPLATGLLILIGKGTKLSARYGVNEEYEGKIHLGHVTTSQDRDGELLQENDASAITREMFEAEIENFKGDIQQIPPMVSAIKKNGTALYKLARKGQEIEREPRDCTIYDYQLTNFENPLAEVKIVCSKGTYIRTLAHDIGANLAVRVWDELRRTASGKFRVENAMTLEEILVDRENIGENDSFSGFNARRFEQLKPKMKLLKQFEQTSETPVVIAAGFDGVHLGHQAVLMRRFIMRKKSAAKFGF